MTIYHYLLDPSLTSGTFNPLFLPFYVFLVAIFPTEVHNKFIITTHTVQNRWYNIFKYQPSEI